MSIYDQDFNIIDTNLTPTQRRLPKWLAWLQALSTPTQWNHDNIFTEYIGGATENYYNPATPYVLGDRVIDSDNGIWESQVSQTDINPSHADIWQYNYRYPLGSYIIYGNAKYISLIANNTAIPGSDLTSWQAIWVKICNSYIGVNERVAYNGQRAMLELALNRTFNWLLVGAYGSARTTANAITYYDSTQTAWSSGSDYSPVDIVNYPINGTGGNITWVALLSSSHTSPITPGSDTVTWAWYQTNRSDIYINNNSINAGAGYIFGANNLLGAQIYGANKPQGTFIYGTNLSVNPAGATIYVPQSSGARIPDWYSTLKANYYNNNDSLTQQAIIQIAQKWAVAGTIFNVTTY